MAFSTKQLFSYVAGFLLTTGCVSQQSDQPPTIASGADDEQQQYYSGTPKELDALSPHRTPSLDFALQNAVAFLQQETDDLYQHVQKGMPMEKALKRREFVADSIETSFKKQKYQVTFFYNGTIDPSTTNVLALNAYDDHFKRNVALFAIANHSPSSSNTYAIKDDACLLKIKPDHMKCE